MESENENLKNNKPPAEHQGPHDLFIEIICSHLKSRETIPLSIFANFYDFTEMWRRWDFDFLSEVGSCVTEDGVYGGWINFDPPRKDKTKA